MVPKQRWSLARRSFVSSLAEINGTRLRNMVLKGAWLLIRQRLEKQNYALKRDVEFSQASVYTIINGNGRGMFRNGGGWGDRQTDRQTDRDGETERD